MINGIWKVNKLSASDRQEAMEERLDVAADFS